MQGDDASLSSLAVSFGTWGGWVRQDKLVLLLSFVHPPSLQLLQADVPAEPVLQLLLRSVEIKGSDSPLLLQTSAPGGLHHLPSTITTIASIQHPQEGPGEDVHDQPWVMREVLPCSLHHLDPKHFICSASRLENTLQQDALPGKCFATCSACT